MKPNKKYHGVSSSDADRGYSDPTQPDDTDPQYETRQMDKQSVQLDSYFDDVDETQGGFLERQNVYDRI